MGNLQVIEHKNQRVLTTQQLAQAYETDPKHISNNYNRNQERFVAGRDFYVLEGDDLQTFKGIHPEDDNLKFVSKLYLWTERGANRHCKILDTDKAWQQFDVLEETYVKVKNNQVPALPQNYGEALRELATTWEREQKALMQLEAAKPKVEFFDAVADSKTAIQIGDAAKVLAVPGIGRNNLFKILRDEDVLMAGNVPKQEYIDRGCFRVVEQKYNTPNGETHISIKTLVYQKGLDYIRRLLEKKSA